MTKFIFALSISLFSLTLSTPGFAYQWEEGCPWSSCPPTQPVECDGGTTVCGPSTGLKQTTTQH